MQSRFTRWAAGAAVALSFLAGAGMAQASSLTSTQVSAILSLLSSFGADQSIINNVSASLGGSSVSQASCLNLSNNLTLGSSGNDVTNLQNYLINKGDFTGTNATGYYGYLTASAVGQLQIALGIVSSQSDSAYGIMGPRTRAAVGCGGTTVISPAQPVAPVQPTQPTSVTPTATIDQSSLGSSSVAGFNITGTVVDAPSLLVVIIPAVYTGSTDWNSTKSLFNASQYKAVGSNPTQGNGEWSAIFANIPAGTYGVYVYDADTHTLLTSGQKNVVNTSTVPPQTTNTGAPTATIDQSSLSQMAGSFSLTGSASNSSQVLIYLSTYVYSQTDYATISGQYGKDGVSTGEAVVSNGRWSLPFTWNTPGATLQVLIYDSTTHALLTSGTLTVGANATTGTQIQSVLNLLQSFGASLATQSDVQKVLSGQTVATPSPASVTQTQAQSILNLLGQFGFSQVVINNVSSALPIISSNSTTAQATSGISVSQAAMPATLMLSAWNSYPFTSFTLTNNSNVVAAINGIIVQQKGTASDSALSSVELTDAASPLTEIGSNGMLNSSHQTTIGNSFTLNPGQSRSFTVYGNMASSISAYSGTTIALPVIAITSNTQISGTLPLTGVQDTIGN